MTHYGVQLVGLNSHKGHLIWDYLGQLYLGQLTQTEVELNFVFNISQTLTLNLLGSSSRLPKIGANAFFARIVESLA